MRRKRLTMYFDNTRGACAVGGEYYDLVDGKDEPPSLQSLIPLSAKVIWYAIKCPSYSLARGSPPLDETNGVVFPAAERQ